MKKGILSKIISVATKLPIKAVSTPAKLIQEATKAKESNTKEGVSLIDVYEFPLVQKALDINKDGVVDLKDLTVLINSKGKELSLKIVCGLGAIGIAYIALRYGL